MQGKVALGLIQSNIWWLTQVMGEHDTDVAEYLYKTSSTRAGVMKLLCKDLSKACVAKLPPLPKVVQVAKKKWIACLRSTFFPTSESPVFQCFFSGSISSSDISWCGVYEQYRGPEEAFTPKVGKQAEMDKLMRTIQVSWLFHVWTFETPYFWVQ